MAAVVELTDVSIVRGEATLLDRVSFDPIMARYLKTSAGEALVGEIRSACT